MVVLVVFMAIVGLAITCLAADSLRWLHSMRKVSDVTGTVVGRDRQISGRGPAWTFPVVEFATPDGTRIRRTFNQLTRPRIGRKLRIVYDPSTLPDGRGRSARRGMNFLSRAPLIYSVWLLLWFWLLAACGIGLLIACVAVLAEGAA